MVNKTSSISRIFKDRSWEGDPASRQQVSLHCRWPHDAMICHAYARGRVPNKAPWEPRNRVRPTRWNGCGPSLLDLATGIYWARLRICHDMTHVDPKPQCFIQSIHLHSLECMYSGQELPYYFETLAGAKHGGDSAYFPRWRGQHGHRWRPQGSVSCLVESSNTIGSLQDQQLNNQWKNHW